MAQSTDTDNTDGEKINVTIQKKTPAQAPEVKKAQGATKEEAKEEKDPEEKVSKQAPTIQPRRQYLDQRQQDDRETTETEDDTPKEHGQPASSVSTSPAERATAKLKPSDDAVVESEEEEAETPSSNVDGVDEYGQQTLTVADYAQQPARPLAHEEERDYKLSRRQLKRPPKGHHRAPAAILSALLLLVLCAIVAAGVYYVSQHSL